MEQYNNYPILTKTKPVNLSSTSSMYSFNSPLAEAGLVWPPRFYSCSFCRREFRSAQALGGHMNVHRRDRAKLKQSNSTSDQEITNPAAFSNAIKTTSTATTTTYEENTRKLIDLVDSDDDGDGEVVMCKRYKKSTGVSPLMMKILYCSGSSSREEIDLELRLGAVK